MDFRGQPISITTSGPAHVQPTLIEFHCNGNWFVSPLRLTCMCSPRTFLLVRIESQPLVCLLVKLEIKILNHNNGLCACTDSTHLLAEWKIQVIPNMELLGRIRVRFVSLVRKCVEKKSRKWKWRTVVRWTVCSNYSLYIEMVPKDFKGASFKQRK